MEQPRISRFWNQMDRSEIIKEVVEVLSSLIFQFSRKIDLQNSMIAVWEKHCMQYDSTLFEEALQSLEKKRDFNTREEKHLVANWLFDRRWGL